MANVVLSIFGLLLIGFAFTFYMLALPAINTGLNTTNGTFQNNSVAVKNIVNNGVQPFAAVFPFLFFLCGMFLVVKGVTS